MLPFVIGTKDTAACWIANIAFKGWLIVMVIGRVKSIRRHG